jgi:hypothetical protein
MKIVEFTMEDARKCADLIALLTATNKLIDSLKLAGIQVQGPAAATKEQTLMWVKELAGHMANEIVEKDKKAKAAQNTTVSAAAPVKTEKLVKKTPAKTKKK